MPESVGSIPLPGVNMETWLLRFDKQGACVSPRNRAALLQKLAADPDRPVILFSHGWNNEYADATDRYAKLLQNLEHHWAQHGPLPGAKPLFIGIIWPSTWFSFDAGPGIASMHGVEVAREIGLREDLAQQLSNSERERFYLLLDQPLIPASQAAELAVLTAKAVKAEIQGAGSEAVEEKAPGDQDVLKAMQALQAFAQPAPNTGGDGLPEGGLVNAGGPPELGHAGALSFLDPRGALRVASVYQMKDRAGVVGANGVARLVEDVLAKSKTLHLVGHSFGAKVVLSAMAAANTRNKAKTALLLQPAISYLCFAKMLPDRDEPGGYHGVPGKVEKSIAITCSAWDVALHKLFHNILRRSEDLGDVKIAGPASLGVGEPPSKYAALGGYGPGGVATAVRKDEMPLPGTRVPEFSTNAMLAFDGTKEKRIDAHGNVSTPFTAWLLYEQMRFQ